MSYFRGYSVSISICLAIILDIMPQVSLFADTPEEIQERYAAFRGQPITTPTGAQRLSLAQREQDMDGSVIHWLELNGPITIPFQEFADLVEASRRDGTESILFQDPNIAGVFLSFSLYAQGAFIDNVEEDTLMRYLASIRRNLREGQRLEIRSGPLNPQGDDLTADMGGHAPVRLEFAIHDADPQKTRVFVEYLFILEKHSLRIRIEAPPQHLGPTLSAWEGLLSRASIP